MSILNHNTQEAAELLQQLKAFSDTTENAADDIANTLCSGGRLLACGNGGSAAEAAHLTTELVVRYRNDRPAYAALCLNVHGGDLTAIGNDYEFQQVFERQVEAFGRTGDCLVVFSSLGRPPWAKNTQKIPQVSRCRHALHLSLPTCPQARQTPNPRQTPKAVGRPPMATYAHNVQAGTRLDVTP